jgi:heptose I phosphotransferase
MISICTLRKFAEPAAPAQQETSGSANEGRAALHVSAALCSILPVLELDEHLRTHLPKENTFDWLMNVEGKVHRAVKNRRTVEFAVDGRTYFIKAHRGVGWREVFKNLLYGRAPIVSAEPEWAAIAALRGAGVNTPAAPAQLESFVIMPALEGMISLEDLARDWRGLEGRQRVLLKRALMATMADIAGRMHGSGLNHRDFYLCHFLVRDREWKHWQPGDPLELVLIDLHRVQRRDRVPERWLVKDLGGLLFSALDAGLTRRDLLRFISAYRGEPWRDVLVRERAFWRKVWRNAVRLYRSFHHRESPLDWRT